MADILFRMILFFEILFFKSFLKSKGLSLDEAYEEEIKKYKFDSSIFDVAVGYNFSKYLIFNFSKGSFDISFYFF